MSALGRPVFRLIDPKPADMDAKTAALAHCRVSPREWFFPDAPTRAGRTEQTNRAKAVCRACVIKTQCLNEALAHPEDEFSIMGETDPYERARIRREYNLPGIPR